MLPAKHTLGRVALVLTSNAVGFVVSMGSILILARHLSVETFGGYSIMLSVQAFGLILINAFSPGMLLHLNRSPDTAKQAEATGFRLRLGAGFLVAFVAMSAGGLLSDWLHPGSHLWPAYALLGMTSFSQGLENHILQVQQSRDRFKAYAFVFMGTRLLKLGGLALLLEIGQLGLMQIFLVLFLGQMVVLAPFWKILRNGLDPAYWDGKLALVLLKNTAWTLTTGLVVFASTRINLFLINHNFPKDQVGYYGFTETMLGSLLLLSQAIMAVAAPKIMGPHVEKNLMRLCGFSAALGVAYLIVVMAAMFAAGPLVALVFGTKYGRSVDLFMVMGFGTACAMAAAAPVALLHRLGRTSWILGLESAGVAVLILADFFLLNRLGIAGAAWAFTISRMTFLTAAVLALTMAARVSRAKS